MSNRKYTQEFRDEAVRHVLNRRYPTKEVAVNLGVPVRNLYRRVKAAKPRPERLGEHDLL